MTRSFSTLMIISLSVLCHSTAHSAEDFFTMSLEELMAVEVSGSTYSGDTLLSVPASVTVFSREDIQELGFEYLHELGNIVPGFQTKRQGSSVAAHNMFARGRQVGTTSRSIKIIVNGQQWSNGLIESNSYSSVLIPLFNIKKVEFVRGPGSVLHGSGAMMASINIETIVDEANFTVGTGNWDRTVAHSNVSYDNWYLSVHTKSHSGEEYRLKDMDSGLLEDSQGQLSESHFHLKYRTSTDNFNFSHHSIRTNGYYMFTRINDNLNQRNRKYSAISYEKNIEIEKHHEWTYRIFANHLSNDLSGEIAGYGDLAAISNPSSNEVLRSESYTEVSQYGFKLFSNQLQLGGHLTYGLEYMYDQPIENMTKANYDLPALANAQIPIAYNGQQDFEFSVFEREENHRYALFSEYEYQISPNLNSIYSLRLDYGSRVDESDISPRLGLVYTPSSNWSFKALYSEAFRNPGPAELGTKNNPAVIGNPSLDSETIKTSEVILFIKGDQTTFNASAYYNVIENAIEQISLPTGRQFFNSESTHNSGVELELRHEFSRGYRVYANLTKELDSLDTSFRLSEEYGSLNFFWKESKLSGSFSSIYHSAIDLIHEGELRPLPSSWHHNASLHYKLNNSKYLSLQISNLMNNHYKTADIGQALDVGLPSEGRQINLSIQIKVN